VSLDQNDCLAFERLIDSAGLAAVLSALSDICGQKAEHVATNWQDTTLAKRWEGMASAISDLLVEAAGL
jgi:hypothetical protein